MSAGKHRSLLAALALRAGDVVAADSLADVVWDGKPPKSWPKTLHNYVMRLRKALGEDVRGLIVTRPPGYQLLASSDDVDVLCYQALCKAGQSAAWARDWQLASDILAKADALWRGTPFVDVPSRSIRDNHLTFLEQTRLNALATRFHADLLISPSRAASILAELQRLSAEHPSNERFRELFMIALSQCGRKQEALAVYQDAWQFSTQELGVTPGKRLRDLNQRILLDEQMLLPATVH